MCLPCQHGSIGGVALFSFFVLSYGRVDLALGFHQILHAVKRQLDVLLLQPYQMIWLKKATKKKNKQK
jgi:hypothetical protein